MNGDRILINTDLDQHVLDSVCEGILEGYPSDAIIEFEAPTMADLMPDKPYL